MTCLLVLLLQIEGIAHVVKQLTTLQLTPSLDSPHYTVLKKLKDYEVRQYSPYLVAETIMAGDARPAGGDGFNELAGYIFGGNSRYCPASIEMFWQTVPKSLDLQQVHYAQETQDKISTGLCMLAL